ncbi:MAG: hypothetical protein HKN28_03030, partial [Alphaproteobacteria bacterium]|nr:hypothetical protein [Alphaproteobacteria bacterium]
MTMITSMIVLRGRNYSLRFIIPLLVLAVATFASGAGFADHSNGHQGTSGGNSSPAIEAQSFSLDENQDAGTAVGDIVATTNRKGGLLTYEITGGITANLFALHPETGALTTTNLLNFEATPSHGLTVQVTDVSGKTASAPITVSVGDVNEAPVANDAVFAVLTLSPENTVIGTVTASDPDKSPPSNSLTYGFVVANDIFEIGTTTGELRTKVVLDASHASPQNFDVLVTDGDLNDPLSTVANITVNILHGAVPSDVSEIDGTNGFRLPGLTEIGNVGREVVILGDVNGDGFDDVAMSSSRLHPDVSGAFVIFGTDQGFDLNFDLASLNGTNGFRFDGTESNDFTGEAISRAGDVNKDGIADILIGAVQTFNENNTTGAVFVVFGAEQFAPVMTKSDLDGTNGFQVISAIGQSGLGSPLTLSSIGDFNGDGVDDFAAALNNETVGGVSPATGKIHVIFGRDTSNNNPDFDPIFDLTNLDASTGMILHGAPGDGVGFLMSPTGDLNDDGLADFIVGATNDFDRIYVAFGSIDFATGTPSDLPIVFDLTTLDGTNGFIVNAVVDQHLIGVTSGGDINGDGVSDPLISVPGEDRLVGGVIVEVDVGATYVIFGTDIWPANFELSSLDGSNGFRILGAAGSDDFGFPADNRSDVNGDGLDDVIAATNVAGIPQLPTANIEDLPPPPPIVYYLIAGSDQPFPATIDLKTLDPATG